MNGLLSNLDAYNGITPPYACVVLVELHQINNDWVVKVSELQMEFYFSLFFTKILFNEKYLYYCFSFSTRMKPTEIPMN